MELPRDRPAQAVDGRVVDLDDRDVVPDALAPGHNLGAPAHDAAPGLAHIREEQALVPEVRDLRLQAREDRGPRGEERHGGSDPEADRDPGGARAVARLDPSEEGLVEPFEREASP